MRKHPIRITNAGSTGPGRHAAAWLVVVAAAIGGGCAPRIDVQYQAHGTPDAELESMRRFAVAHSPAEPQRGVVLTRRVADAFGRYLAEHGYHAVADQKALATARDRNALLQRAASFSRRAFRQRGYRLDPADPQFVISLDCAHGPVRYRIPPPLKLDDSDRAGRGRAVTEYAHAVAVYVYDVRRPRRPAWVGWAITLCPVEDLQIMRALLAELAGQFPEATDGMRRVTRSLD